MSGFVGSLDNGNTSLNVLFGAAAVDDKGFVFVDLDFLCKAEVVKSNIGKGKADVIAYKGCAGECGNIKKHFFSSLAEAGALYAAYVKSAAEFVDDEVGKSVAFNIFGNDKELFACSHGKFKNRYKLLEGGNLLVNKKDGAVLHNGNHLVGIGYHVRRKEAAVEFHTFNNFDISVCGFAVLNGDDTIGSNLFHCLGNKIAEFRIAAGDSCNSCNILRAGDLLCVLLNSGNGGVNGFLNTAFDEHGVCTCGYVLHTLANKCLCKKGCSGGAVAGSIVGFGCNFFYNLSTHVLKRIFKGDFLGDGNTIVADDRSAEFFIKNNIAALRAKGDFYGIGKFVDTILKLSSGFIAIKNLFCHI